MISDVKRNFVYKLLPKFPNSFSFTQTYFSYNPKEDKVIPCKEAGLEFQKGDILHIVDMEDRNWWQAKKEGDPTNRAGLLSIGKEIPPKKQVCCQ